MHFSCCLCSYDLFLDLQVHHENPKPETLNPKPTASIVQYTNLPLNRCVILDRRCPNDCRARQRQVLTQEEAAAEAEQWPQESQQLAHQALGSPLWRQLSSWLSPQPSWLPWLLPWLLS